MARFQAIIEVILMVIDKLHKAIALFSAAALIAVFFSLHVLAIQDSDLHIRHLRIVEEYLHPGDMMMVPLDLENLGRPDFDDVRVCAGIMELDVRGCKGPFDIDDRYKNTIFLEIPDHTMPGEYLVKTTISNQHVKRTKYRFVVIR